MAENDAVPERLTGVLRVVFLFCLAALIPLGVAEWYSGQDAPNETQAMYDTLEKILVGVNPYEDASDDLSLKRGAKSDFT